MFVRILEKKTSDVRYSKLPVAALTVFRITATVDRRTTSISIIDTILKNKQHCRLPVATLYELTHGKDFKITVYETTHRKMMKSRSCNGCPFFEELISVSIIADKMPSKIEYDNFYMAWSRHEIY